MIGLQFNYSRAELATRDLLACLLASHSRVASSEPPKDQFYSEAFQHPSHWYDWTQNNPVFYLAPSFTRTPRMQLHATMRT